ncbi:PREDICTED: putative F-box protein At1g58090 [Camelina sativa]|uniref:F-box protein At1g58090 n=1 Tax=Camelina sativa TaxID=90675 RepID=A0ABM1QIY9_CAMSA|nr:PREDICTED: putative F-box protein At1g58090 [Camelina sativa]
MSSSPRKLPLDLEEEILVRVPPRSLVGFKSVCKGWNTLFNDKRFVNKQLAFGRPEILLKTPSRMYSISVDLNKDDPTTKVSDLCVNFHDRRYILEGTCDGNFFINDFHKLGSREYVVLNPLLMRHRIVADAFSCCKGIGYDGSRPQKSYKIIGKMNTYWQGSVTYTYSVFQFATNTWKVTDHTSFPGKSELISEAYNNARVSLNGNLYWTAYTYPETGQYFIQMLDFSKEMERTFCGLPCKGELNVTHTRILSIYKGDQFSVLEQSNETGEIEIWVTKDKIGNGDNGDDVVCIKFLTVSVPDFPMLLSNNATSYYVDNNIYGKSFVLCFPSMELKQAWVYIVRGDLCKKIKIDEVPCEFQSSLYVPSLITIS